MGKPPRTKMPAAGVDGDEAVFLELSRELKEEGVRLFNRRDYEGAAFQYGKAVQLLPSGRRVEAAHLRTSIAQCYMRMSPGEFHRAIHECNLALEAAPRYSRALLRRAACFEAMGRPDLAWGDVERVLRWEPSNRAAGVMSERMRAALEEIGVALPLDREDMQSEGDIASARGEEMRNKSHKHFDSQAEVNEGNNGNHVVLQEEEAASTDGGKGNQAMHLKGKKQKHGDDKQEKQASQMQINGIRNHRNHAEVTETNGLEKEEQNAETKEDTGNKRGQYAAGKKARRGGKQQKNCAVDHGEDNHYKHIEENNIDVKEVVVKDVKLVFGEDIRCAQMPVNCSMSQLRDIVQNKFPSLKALLIKYKDKEEDLVTITSSEELRWANNLADSEGPIRLYVSEVSPVQELGVDGVRKRPSFATLEKIRGVMLENGSIRHDDEHNYYVDDWMVQFAHLLKNHVGFNSDAYLHLHDLGLRLYYEAMEDTTESEEALEVFEVAELKFQEMAALALFNWGHVHMSRARKRPCLPEDSSLEFILEQVKVSYEWACTEYVKAGSMFEEAVKSKSGFFEGLIALGQLQYEQAKLSWYYALACKIDMGTEVLELFNHAEDSMEKGMDMWERMECVHLKGLSKPSKERAILEKMGLEGFMKDIPADEAYEQASSIRSHINILWGTILYERSVVEFNLALPCWEESLTVAMEKFKIGGASPADINVIVKNHCANETTQEGLSFKVEEIVQAWNEMYDAKSWRSGALSSRLQPIFRRRAPKLHHILEHLHYT